MIEKSRIVHLKNLIVIAMADGVLHPMEREFIKEKASLLDLNEDELDILFAEAISVSKIMVISLERREEQLADAVLMTVIDGNIHDKELEIIKDFGLKLNFSLEYIDKLLKKSTAIWNNAKTA